MEQNIGITEKEQMHLFEASFRAHNTGSILAQACFKYSRPLCTL